MAIESLNPTTGELLRSFPEMGKDEVDRILDAAVRAQKAWALVPVAERAVPMRKVAALLRERAPELGRLAALEMGKPVKDGAAEAVKCAWVCEYYAENAEKFLAPRPETSDGSRAYVRFDPLGVILAVMPWNFPYWQVFRFIAPHLMAGNGGLLKHASNVPQCALAIEKLMHDAGFPPDLFRTLLIGSKPVRGIILDPRIAAATITGSEPAGRAVAAAAGESLKPSVMELGGSDPFIVLADADLDQAAKVGAVARTINAGQSCICAKRFIVESTVYDAFLAKFTAAMQAVKVGDPMQPGTDIGPQARTDLRDEMHELVKQAIAEGARPAMGCTLPTRTGSLLPGVDPRRREDLQRRGARGALRAGGGGDPGRLGRPCRRDRQRLEVRPGRLAVDGSEATVERLVPRIEAGAVFVNGLVKSDPRLPFGGVKTSGYGRELGLEGIRAFVNVKTVWVK